MITPNDIATKDFKKVAVGYSPEEVDTFLMTSMRTMRSCIRKARRKNQRQRLWLRIPTG